MRPIGIVLKLLYRLQNHHCAGWPLSRWVGFILVAGGLAALIARWPRIELALFLGLAWLLYVLLLAWAGRRRFVHFVPLAQGDDPPEPGLPPLGKAERVPIRASGWFSVQGKERHLADLEADYESVGTREHIVLGRLHPSRFLGLGRWPAEELGWWYIFIQPAMIRRLQVGHLCFGAQPRLALQVVYAADEEKQETVHLIFEDAQALHRVWEDLIKDAPPGAAG